MAGLGTQFEAADDSAGLLLWQITNRWQAAQRAALKPFGPTHVQYVLLASLTWLSDSADGSGEPVTQKALADHAATDPMMTSQVLRVLESRGLLRRTPHPGDARAKALQVTGEGSELARRATAAVEQCDEEVFGALGRRRAGFASDLRTLRDGLGPGGPAR